ncbi:MAG: peptidase S41 [Deltaproteobacteria bacterium RBG_13_47_9]|nr:MAG: peptidase S41 [Deltaproteobacteria bacterium RBG_13_47_9]
MLSQKGFGNLRIILVISLVFLVGVAIGLGRFHKVSALSNSTYEDLKVFTDVLGLLQRDYVEETNSKDLVYGAIKGMLETLDPHSAFMPPNTYKEMQEETKGRFEGIGIEIEMKNSILTVVSPIVDTPAFKAGIQAGDQIVKIEGEPTKNLTLLDSVKRLRGPKGSNVTISIMREGFTKPQEFTLIRDVIPVKSVRYELLEKEYGYIRVTQFQEKTDSEFEKAMKALEEETKGSLKGLILDLRNNPGGLLDQAVKVTDRFVESGLIVSVEGRREDQKIKFYAHPEGTVNHYPLILLINGGSASGAEIVAGAIQDHGRGILLGTQTFGKGSVQTIFPLKDGSGLRLTTARYYTPNGRSIQAKGIVPDIAVKPSQTEGEKAVPVPKFPSERDLERHLIDVGKGLPKEKEPPQEKEPTTEQLKKEETKKEESKKEETKEKKPTDIQLERALELLKSWEIFKGVAQGK